MGVRKCEWEFYMEDWMGGLSGKTESEMGGLGDWVGGLSEIGWGFFLEDSVHLVQVGR